MFNGLSAGIINPLSEEMMKSYYAYHALMNLDENCQIYIQKYSAAGNDTPTTLQGMPQVQGMTLCAAIERGLKEEAERLARECIKEQRALEIINGEAIPALDSVGKGFEAGTIFLSSAAFDECRCGKSCV